MRRALLLVDVVNTFDHADGDALLDSFSERRDGLVAAVERARAAGIPLVYANDNWGAWDGDAPKLVREAVAGRGGELVAAVAPRQGDRFVVKPRYSAFDHTPLVLILRELDAELLLVAGAATEMCVVQTAIDARELGFKVTVLADACAAVDERLEAIGLEYLVAVGGCRVERVADVLGKGGEDGG